MTVSMATAEQALKVVYLELLQNQLNVETSPMYNKIKTSTRDITGKEVKKAATYGVNGGYGAGSETGALPAAAGNSYIQLTSSTKNLYGTIEITDKSILASQNNVGAFVDLLTSEMEGLTKAAKWNFSRQLVQNGEGKLAAVTAYTSGASCVVDSVKYLMEGQVVDIWDTSGSAYLFNAATVKRIIAINRATRTVTFDGTPTGLQVGDIVYVQNSKNLELTGVAEIFNTNGTSLYGLTRANYPWLNPYIAGSAGALADTKIQAVIDYLEEVMGSKINFLWCSSGVKRAYQAYMEATKRSVNTLELKGGFTALSYNGVPLVSDKFHEAQKMHFFDTDKFTFHQLCDWRWMDEDGKVLKQVPGYPVWRAHLVKYAELICDHPGGQGQLPGITEA